MKSLKLLRECKSNANRIHAKSIKEAEGAPAYAQGGVAKQTLRTLSKAMFFRILLLLSLIYSAPGTFAADAKPLGGHTLPTLTIPEALQIAERYLADEKLDTSKHLG